MAHESDVELGLVPLMSDNPENDAGEAILLQNVETNTPREQDGDNDDAGDDSSSGSSSYSPYEDLVPREKWRPGDPTALEMVNAIERNDVAALDRLLKDGADPNATYPLRREQAQFLCTLEWDESIEKFCKKPTWDGARAQWSMLQFASAFCKPEACSKLLEHGARVNDEHARRTALDVAGAPYADKYPEDLPKPPINKDFEKVVELLVEHGGECKTMRGELDGVYAPLHTAVRLGCARAVRLLLDRASRVDCADFHGLTPLHWSIMTKNKDILIMLLEHGLADNDLEGLRVRANTADRFGATLLHAAVGGAWLDGVHILLQAGADVTLCLWEFSETEGRRWHDTPLHIPGYHAPLHLAVQLGNMEIFMALLQIAKQNSSIDCRNNYGQTPLFVAIEERNLQIFKILRQNGASLKNVSLPKKFNALHAAALYYDKDESILKFILDNEDVTDLIDELDEAGDGPIHVAILSGEEPIKLLLDKGANILLQTRAADDRDGSTALHLAAAYNKMEEAREILWQDRHRDKWMSGLATRWLDARDAQDRTPLQVAALTPSRDVLLVLLQNGGVLAAPTPTPTTLPPASSTTALLPTSAPTDLPPTSNPSVLPPTSTPTALPSPIELIATKVPNPAGFFEEVFDSCLSQSGMWGYVDTNVHFNVLTGIDRPDQLAVVEELIRCGQDRVLVHPVIETLLYIKWTILLPIFYVILGIYGLFVVSLNVFAGTVFYYRDVQRNGTNVTNVVNVTIITNATKVSNVINVINVTNGNGTTEDVPQCPNEIRWVFIFVGFIYLSICFLLALEYVHIKAKGWAYLRQVETCAKLSSLVLGGALVPLALADASGSAWTRHVASAALLSAWLSLMFLCSRFPRWGYFILMIGKVAANIAKILLTCVFLIVAFALSFMIQFQARPPFDGPFAAFTKTLVMMTSEFDYEGLFGEDHDEALENSRIGVRLLFIIFLLFVAIVLMNFMVGMAVNDIQELTVTGNKRRLRKQTELLSILDDLVYNGILNKILPKKIVEGINKKRFISGLRITPKTDTTWTWIVGSGDNDKGEIFHNLKLPTHLHEGLISKSENEKYAEECIKKANTKRLRELHEAVIKKLSFDELLKWNSDDDDLKLETRFDELINNFQIVKQEVEELKGDRQLLLNKIDEISLNMVVVTQYLARIESK